MSNVKHNTKGSLYDMLHLWLGAGLLTSNGNKWQKRRKILTPAFHFSILQEFIKIFYEETAKLVETLHQRWDEPFVDVTDLISDFTLTTITGNQILLEHYRQYTNLKIRLNSLSQLTLVFISVSIDV